MTKRILFLILIGITSTQQFLGQIVTDRPDQTESSSTVPKNSLQLESGAQISFQDKKTYTNRKIILPTTLFRYGITKGIELRLVNQYEANKEGSFYYEGISDIEIGTKIILLKKENVNTEVAFLSHLILPIGSMDISSNSFGTINKLCISHQITKESSFGYNLGYNYLGKGIGDLSYTFSYGISVNKSFGIYIEPYGSILEMKDLIINMDAGLTYSPNPNIQLDYSFGAGINNHMNYIALGCSWLFLK